MDIVYDFSEYRAAYDQVKSVAERFTTNFYATSQLIETWIGRRALFMFPTPGNLMLLRQDRNFFHVYHLASSPKALSDGLAALVTTTQATLVTDLLGRPEDTAPWLDLYQHHNFAHHQTLVRMSRGLNPNMSYDLDPEIQQATRGEASTVLGFLEKLLDPLTEQVPTILDLEDLIDAGRIILVRRGNALGGVLIFEITGVAAVLKYWFVDQGARDQGIGSKLIHAFFQLCQNCRRISLWVIASNEDSIRKYEHYGFSRDSTLDQILVRQS